MTSLSSLVFLSLVCLTAGYRLPLREGTTVTSLMTSPVLDDLATAGVDLADRLDDMVQNVTDFIAESTDTKVVNELFVEPFMMGFNRKSDKSASSNTTARAVLKPQLTEVMIVALYEPYTQFRDDVSFIIIGAMEILAHMPNWLNTTAFMKVDLGKLNLDQEGLLSILSEVIKVPKRDSEKMEKLYSMATKLFPAHGFNLGSRLSKVTSELNFSDLLSALTHLLPASLASYFPMIAMFISSNLNSVYPILSNMLPM